MTKSSGNGPKSPLRDRMKDVERQLEQRIRERERLAMEMAALTGPSNEAILSSLVNQAQLAEDAKRLQKFLRERKPAALPRAAAGFDPIVASPRGTIFRAPFDPNGAWTWTLPGSPGTQQVSADPNTGAIHLGASGGGGVAGVAAGLGVFYTPQNVQTQGDVFLHYQFEYHWLDSASNFLSASNFGSVHISVFQDGQLLLEGNHQLWTDHLSAGLGSPAPHHDDQSGWEPTLGPDAYSLSFPMKSSSSYEVLFWCDIAVSDSNGFLSFSFAQATLDLTVYGFMIDENT